MSHPIGEGVKLAPAARSAAATRWVRIGVGALVVALAAQIAIPLPFTPVPFTLQPLAVLIVGGLLGARAGAAALVLYLALGLVGLPVFAAGGSGIGRLMGPTGGYLLAFPVAAAVVGYVSEQWGRRGREGRTIPSPPSPLARPVTLLAACALGMVVIHVGGSAQLALLTGNPELALRTGFFPFLTGDLLKIGLAALVVLLLGPRLRRTS